MLDIEKTNNLKRKLESMKTSDKQVSDENKKRVEKGVSSLLTVAFRVAILYFAHKIIFERYNLGAPFSFWETTILYWGAGTVAGLFKTNRGGE